MADENPKGLGVDGCLATFDEDEREEAAVLRRVLELHPSALTMVELLRDLTGGRSRDFGDFDATQRAVRDLTSAGLLHPLGEEDMVRPTRAALRYSELMGGVVA